MSWPPPPLSPRPPRRRDAGAYAAALVVLAPFLAETVASSNTPAVLFPLLLPVYAVIYGAPALLVRELWVRGRLTLWRVLLLGLAYTAFNEGVVAATWFKLSATNGKVLSFTAAQAGHVGGVNWAVAVNLVVFHTVFSLVMPVVLIQSVAAVRRPELAARPWIGRPVTILCMVAIGFVLIGSFTPKAAARACAGPAHATCLPGRGCAAALALLLVLLVVAAPVRARSTRPAARPGRAVVTVLAGVAFAVAFFAAFFALPLAGLPGVAVATGVVLEACVAVAIAHAAPALCWNTRTGVLLCAGALSVGMLASLRGLAVGQPVAAALAAWLLTWLVRRTARVDVD